METPIRPNNQFNIQVRGDVVALIVLGKLLRESQFGIKLKELPDMGDKELVINLKNDTFYVTEKGNDPYLYKRFNYPQDKMELLKELCYESKRRSKSH